MKKIFLSFLAIIAMVGMVSAQRTWAYGLNMTQEGDNYTFVFKSTTAATAANLVFTDAAGEVAGKVALENVVAGENTKVLALADIPGEGTLNWAVELTGAAIDEVTKLTDDSQYNGFWFAYGVGVNNNPESDYFGNIYVSNPRHSSAPAQTGFYKYSPELVLDSTLFVDGTKVGYKPSNVTLANAVDAIQRIAVSPVDGTVAFVQWNSKPYAVYGMNPVDLNGEAKNLTEGINQPTALCYDHEGALCVLSYDGKSDNKSVYSIYTINGEDTIKVFSGAGWVLGGYDEIASDGQGGFYVLSGTLNTSNVVQSGKLQHISKKGIIDLEVVQGTDTLGLPANFNRLRLAYDLKHNVFAIGGGKKVTLYNATYDAETGAPTLTKWTETAEITTNMDGIAFDYAGDLYVVSAGTETFYKFALPTADNTCVTPAKKAQVIVKETTEEPVDPENPVEPEEPTYEIYEQAITNLVIDFDNLILTGGPSEEFIVKVKLGLGEYDMTEGIFQLLPESEISVQGYDATFVEGWAYVDGIANTAEAVVRCLWNDMAIEFHLSMSAAPLEATVVVVENAAVEIEKVLLFGDMYDYALKMTGIWTNEGVDYPVLVEVPVYYPEATEPSEINSTVTVGGWGDDDPRLGFGEGILTITTIDGVVTATGVVTNQGAGIAIDITISGTVPQDPTGVENNTINVKAVKVIRDGQLIIRNNGVEFNAQGAVVK